MQALFLFFMIASFRLNRVIHRILCPWQYFFLTVNKKKVNEDNDDTFKIHGVVSVDVQFKNSFLSLYNMDNALFHRLYTRFSLVFRSILLTVFPMCVFLCDEINVSRRDCRIFLLCLCMGTIVSWRTQHLICWVLFLAVATLLEIAHR